MFSCSVWRHMVLIFSLTMGLLSYAQVPDRFTVVVDSDQDPTTGCSYTLADGQTVNGVEHLIHVDVVRNGTALEVGNIRRQSCSTDVFGAETLVSSGGWQIGSGNGDDSADVIEGRVPLDLFRGSTGLRLVVQGVAADGDYDVVQTVAPGGDAITYLFPAPIPTLGAWMLLVYIGLMLVAAFWLRRRKNIGPGANVLLLLIALFLLGFARDILLDGQVGDWSSEARLAADPRGDTPGANPRADILAFYACDGGNSFFFRFDIADLEIFGPDTTPDTAVTDEETPVSVAVLANDNDGNGGADGANLTLVGVEDAPQNGTAVAEPDMTITYTPANDFVGEDSFTYRVRNTETEESVETVTVTVNNTPDPPTPVDDTATTDEDNAVTIDVLANDTDPDPGDTLTVVAVATPTNGATVITAEQTITYTPDADFNGDDTFTYTVEDGDGSRVDASVTVTVAPQNDPPEAVDDAITVTDAAVAEALDVLANDLIAPDTGETLTITAVGTPSQGGTVVISGGTALAYTPPGSFLGTETFTYDIEDGNGGSDQATVTITVVPDNNPPIVNDDTFVVVEDSTDNAFDVLANDTTDPDVGETLTIESVGTPDQGGSVSIVGGTSLLYTPAADFAGTETFVYTANDGNGLSASATVTVTVPNSSDPPSAVDDVASLDEDTNVLIDVLANDSDPDPGDTLTIALVGAAGNGTAVLETGQIRYTPNADFNGADSFTYTMEDSTNQAVSATVNVTVNPLNDPPTANDDTFQVTDAAVAEPLTPLANDSFAPDAGETLTITNVGTPTQSGTVVIIDGGTRVAYTPPAAFLGDDTFTYTISDGNGGQDMATVTVTVVPDNNPPVLSDDAFTVNEDSTDNSLDVLVNDSTAPDVGETLTIESIGVTDNGGVVVNNGGTSLTYTPAADFFGTETFTYTANDGNGGRDTATVTVTVNNTNDDPTAVADTATVAEDSTDNPVSVLANDDIAPDVGETLSISAVGTPDNGGAAVIAGTNINYTPAADFFGTEVFTYTLSDGNGGTAIGTVTMTVTNSNDDPTAADDAETAVEDGGTVNFTVLSNDSDAPDSGETLTITAVGTPDNGGAAVISAGTSINYTPATDFFGTETFTYTIGDGNGGTDTATVTVTVSASNDDPTAVADTATVAEDSTNTPISVLANDQITPDVGETLSISAVGTPDNGGAAVISGTNINYTPATDFFGTETFTYTIGDGNGGSDTASVVVTVTPQNDNPTAVNDAETVNEDGGGGTFTVLTNDTFAPDTGETLTITAVGTPDNGGSAVIAGGTAITYAPALNFFGTETFTYTIGDGNGGVDTATVTVTVLPTNDPPTANDDTFAATEDDPTATLSVLTNDSFAPDVGETLTVSAVGATDQGGTAVIAASGAGVDYTPAAAFSGTETFTYTVSDGNGGSDNATVTVNVAAGNAPPVADDETYNVIGNTLFHINSAGAIGNPPTGAAVYDSGEDHLLVGDTDPDMDTLTVTAGTFTTTNGGSITLAADGSFSYRPPAGFTTDSYTYTVSDTSAATDTGTITFNMSDMIWYFDDSFAGTPDGTSSAPFNSVQDLTAAPFADNHIVFVAEGNSTTPGNEWDGLWNLRAGMRLIGEGVLLEVSHPDSAGNLTVLAAGTHPVLTNSSGDILSVTDAAGVVIDGVDLQDANDNGLAVTATSAATSVTLRNSLLSGHTGEGILVRNNHTADLTLSLDGNALSSAGNALDAALTSSGNIILQMDNHTDVTATAGNAVVLNGSGGAGSLFVTSFSGNSISGDTSGTGLSANTVVFDTDTALPLAQVSLGTFNVGSAVNEVGGTAVSLTAVDGSLAFDNLNLYGTSGALTSSSSSTFDTNSGGLRLETTDGVLQTVAGPALTLTASTAQLGLTTVNSVDSPSTGVSLTGVEGTLNVTGDTLASGSVSHGFQVSNASVAVTMNRLDIDNVGGSGLFFDGWSGIITINNNGAGSDISNTTGTAIDLNNGSANMTYAGSVANTAGLVVEQTAQQSGTVSLTGTVTSNAGGQGVSALNNVGGALTFSGPVTLNTAANNALTLSNNSGTTSFLGNVDFDTTTGLGVSGSSGGTLHINGGTNTLDTTNGPALSLVNTTIGGNGATQGIVLRSISSNGGATGFTLNNTGTGRFVVTGTGTTNASGGTIQNKTGRGAELISANNISLSNITFTSVATTDGAPCDASETDNSGCNAAVHMQTVDTVILDNVNASGGQIGVNGNAVANLTLSDSSLQNHGNGINEHGLRLQNVSGASALTNSNISSNNAFNVFILNSGATNLTSLNVTGCTINSATTESGFKFEGAGTSQATVTLAGNTISNNSSGAILTDFTDSAIGNVTIGTTTSTGNADFLQMTADLAAQVTYDVNGNTGISSTSAGMSFLTNTTTTTGSMTGQIRNNSFTVTNAATSEGLRVIGQGSGDITTTITNNTVNYTGIFTGILVWTREGDATVSATVTNNNVISPDINGEYSYYFNSGVLASDSGTLCIEFSGNSSTLASGLEDVRLRQRHLTTFQIEGLGASGVTNAATVEANVAGQNPALGTVVVRSTGTGTLVDYDDPGPGGCLNP